MKTFRWCIGHIFCVFLALNTSAFGDERVRLLKEMGVLWEERQLEVDAPQRSSEPLKVSMEFATEFTSPPVIGVGVASYNVKTPNASDTSSTSSYCYYTYAGDPWLRSDGKWEAILTVGSWKNLEPSKMSLKVCAFEDHQATIDQHSSVVGESSSPDWPSSKSGRVRVGDLPDQLEAWDGKSALRSGRVIWDGVIGLDTGVLAVPKAPLDLIPLVGLTYKQKEENIDPLLVCHQIRRQIFYFSPDSGTAEQIALRQAGEELKLARRQTELAATANKQAAKANEYAAKANEQAAKANAEAARATLATVMLGIIGVVLASLEQTHPGHPSLFKAFAGACLMLLGLGVCFNYSVGLGISFVGFGVVSIQLAIKAHKLPSPPAI